jgi:hypothetical protein
MGLFTRRPAAAPYTLEGHSQDWALDMGAPQGIAACYAEYIVAEDAGGAFGELGANHVTEWPAWTALNIAECPHCGNPWAIFTPCASDWECWACGFSWDAEAS